jgi:hypothetical protein
VVIFLRPKQRTVRFALAAIAALIAAFSIVGQANAETIGVTNAPPAVEGPVAEQVETVASTVPTPEADVAEPVETEEITSAVASSPDPVGDSAAASTASGNPNSTAHSSPSTTHSSPSTTALDPVVDHVAPSSAADAADAAVTTAATSVGTSGRLKPGEWAGPTSKQRLSELTDGVRRVPIGTAVLATERVRDALIDPVSQAADLFDPILSDPILSTNGAAEAPVGPSPAGGQPAANGTTTFTQSPNLGLLSSRNPIALELVPGVYLPTIAGSKANRALPAKRSDGEAARSSTGGVANTDTPSDATAVNRASPTPSDVPPPAPESPATAVADSGGTSFVPIAALLALLALVAPAATRRLGKAPDFRAPTPFTCALERPG